MVFDIVPSEKLYTHGSRDWLFWQADGECSYCGELLLQHAFHVEHVHPVCQGGTSKLSNLVASCIGCNNSKGGRTVRQWIEKGKYVPPTIFEHIKTLGALHGWALWYGDSKGRESDPVNYATALKRRMGMWLKQIFWRRQ